MCTGMTSYHQPDGWISVNDRLPSKVGEVLVFKKITGYFVTFWDGKSWIDFPFNDFEVTHWQELPEPPRMEDEE